MLDHAALIMFDDAASGRVTLHTGSWGGFMAHQIAIASRRLSFAPRRLVLLGMPPARIDHCLLDGLTRMKPAHCSALTHASSLPTCVFLQIRCLLLLGRLRTSSLCRCAAHSCSWHLQYWRQLMCKAAAMRQTRSGV